MEFDVFIIDEKGNVIIEQVEAKNQFEIFNKCAKAYNKGYYAIKVWKDGKEFDKTFLVDGIWI